MTALDAGPPSGAMMSPATARNRGPILAVLQPRLPAQGVVLEIASGAGEHAVYNAAAMPGWWWQPTDPAPDALASIAAWRAHAGLANLLAPLRLDAADQSTWPAGPVDAVVAINMIHISPWAVTEGLMTGAGRVLRSGGVLFLYGPYVEAGVATAPSNVAFDVDLRRRNAAWGIRRLEDVTEVAGAHGLTLWHRIDLPANNLGVFFRKV